MSLNVFLILTTMAVSLVSVVFQVIAIITDDTRAKYILLSLSITFLVGGLFLSTGILFPLLHSQDSYIHRVVNSEEDSADTV